MKLFSQRGKGDVVLYNLLFPFWMLLMFPVVWLIVLPVNFIIDSLVLLLFMLVLKIENKKQYYKKHILKIYAFGMLSDLVGAGYMLLMMAGFQVGNMGDELYLTLPALAISAVVIFGLNYFITFCTDNKKQRLLLSLAFAVVTAPYTFLVPSSWLYG